MDPSEKFLPICILKELVSETSPPLLLGLKSASYTREMMPVAQQPTGTVYISKPIIIITIIIIYKLIQDTKTKDI